MREEEPRRAAKGKRGDARGVTCWLKKDTKEEKEKESHESV